MNPRYACAVAGWAQRWHGGDPAWVHERFGFAPDDYGVDLIPRKTAAGFILAHHYSRSAPAMRKYRFGLFHLAGGQPVLCGVAILTIPPRKEVLTGVFLRLEAFLNQATMLIHSCRSPRRRPVGLNAGSLIDPLGSDRWDVCTGSPTEQTELFALPVLRSPVPSLPARPSLWEAS
jgi:hypothetical protein